MSKKAEKIHQFLSQINMATYAAEPPESLVPFDREFREVHFSVLMTDCGKGFILDAGNDLAIVIDSAVMETAVSDTVHETVTFQTKAGLVKLRFWVTSAAPVPALDAGSLGWKPSA